jgi:ankyrin repeat protein
MVLTRGAVTNAKMTLLAQHMIYILMQVTEVQGRRQHLNEFLQFLQTHQRDTGKWSSLVAAVEYGEPVVLQILLDSGIDANIADHTGKLPLLRAAELGDVTLVLMLIGNGAKLMIEDKDGRSALHQAAKQGHTEVMRHLIDIGANMSAGNRYIM